MKPTKLQSIDASDPMYRTLHRASLQHSVATAIFCPQCRNVMDVRRAVEIGASADGKTVACMALCSKCADAVDLDTIADRILAKNPDVDEFTIDWLDGRSLFGRAKKRHPSQQIVWLRSLQGSLSASDVLPGQLSLFPTEGA